MLPLLVTSARPFPACVCSEVFGGEPTQGFRFSWLLPTPIYYPDPESLTGYCFRELPRQRSLLEEETFDAV
jgi:hypothetical protein